MPPSVIKEIEYVLDLAPTYFWPVGPGTVDPERHVFAVTVSGVAATFERAAALPSPP